MSKRLTRILGAGLTIAVLASMLVVATPASAGFVGWSAGAPPVAPATVNNVDIVDFAVAANGTTAYAASSVNNSIQKTTNGGTVWAPTGFAGGQARKIAVAKDVADGSLVFAIVDNNEIWVSENGGTVWGQMAVVADGASVAAMLYSIDIGPAVGGGRTIVVGGTNGGGVAGVWYYTVGGGIVGPGNIWIDAASNAGWVLTAYTASDAALAVKVSPNFIADRSIAVVTGPTTASGASVLLQVASIASKKWNQDVFGTGVGPFGTGAVVQAGVAGNAIVAAEITVPAGFNLGDATSTVTYVALADNSTGGGVYRQTNGGAATNLLAAGTDSGSVALNAAGDKLVAGAYASNAVYRLATPGTALAGTAAPASKAPSFPSAGKTVVDFLGTSVGAATAGGFAFDESAFAISGNDGAAFNDVAFVDTQALVSDLSVNADGSKIYLVTNNPTVLAGAANGVSSLWRKTTAWERVYKRANAPAPATGYIVRNALDNFDVVFFAQCGGYGIWVSNDAGQTTWSGKSSFQLINDLAAESVSVIYVLAPNGMVSKAVDGGFLFDNPITDTLTATATGAQAMKLIAKDNLLVVGDKGTNFSTDGAKTWQATAQALAGATLAIADKLSAGGVITAVAGTAVKTYTIGTSAAYGAVNAATLDAGYVATGIVINGGVTYIMTNNGTDSAMWRSKITSLAWSKVTSTANLGTDPTGLAAGTGGLLWAVNTEDNSIWSYTEIMAAAGPALSLPADKAVVPINIETGFANAVVIQWTPIANSPVGTLYNMQIALDSGFTQNVVNVAGINGVMAIVGNNSAAPYNFVFTADTTYYLRVRVDTPVDSPWSTARSFKIDALRPLALQSPAAGSSGVSTNPTFVWSPVAGATTYELVVSDDPTFAIITFSRTTSQPVFASDEQLAYSTVYYWRVRASAPATAVTAFATGIFTTAAKPVPPTTPPPPVTVTQTSMTVTVPPAETVEVIPPYLLYIIIGIGVILVISLFVLIYRTRARG